MHSVKREQTALKRQGLDHGLRSGDFVALFVHLQMAKDQRLINRKSAQDMRRLAKERLIAGR